MVGNYTSTLFFHTCQSEGASSTRVWRKITSTSGLASSTVMSPAAVARRRRTWRLRGGYAAVTRRLRGGYVALTRRTSAEVHWVHTAANRVRRMVRASVRKSARPFSGEGETKVTNR